jgi:triacylglycerol lipase
MSDRNPVLLLHGIFDTQRIFSPLRQHLTQAGWTVHGLDMTPNFGIAPLETLAEQVAAYVEQTLPGQPIDLVGFSMGGIVGRYYLQRLGGLTQVQRFITLSSPHRGTLTGNAWPLAGGQQLRYNSPFLRSLNADVACLQQVQFTSIWTPYDLMIVPAHSSQLGIGQDHQVPVWVHRWMVSDPRCLRLVESCLTQPLPTRDRPLPQSPLPQRPPRGGSST